jgi:hypothetical protein
MEPREEPLDELRRLIAEHGWAVRHVVDPNPAKCFSYTVGLSSLLHPELVMTGLPPDVAHAFLNVAASIVAREHGHFAPGEQTTKLADGRSFPVIAVADVSGLTAVESLFGDVRAVQIVWTDSQGNLPWDAAYRNPPGSQPLLGPR